MSLSALEKSQALYEAIESNKLKDIEELLENGANPNRLLISGITPFHLAIGSPKAKDLVEIILKYHGNPNVCDGDGQTPLHIAAEWGKADILHLLLTNGGDVDAETRDGHDVSYFASDTNCKIILNEFIQKQLISAQNRSSLDHHSEYFSPRHLKSTREASSTGRLTHSPRSATSSPFKNITNIETSSTPSQSSNVFRFDVEKSLISHQHNQIQIPPISITVNINNGEVTSSVGDLLTKVEHQVACSIPSSNPSNKLEPADVTTVSILPAVAEKTVSLLTPPNKTVEKSDSKLLALPESTVSQSLLTPSTETCVKGSDSLLALPGIKSDDDGVFDGSSSRTPLCFDRSMLSKCIDATSPNHPFLP